METIDTVDILIVVGLYIYAVKYRDIPTINHKPKSYWSYVHQLGDSRGSTLHQWVFLDLEMAAKKRWKSEHLSHISAIEHTQPQHTSQKYISPPVFVGNHSSKDMSLLYQPTIFLASISTYLAPRNRRHFPRNSRHNAVAHMNFTFRMFVVPLLSHESQPRKRTMPK